MVEKKKMGLLVFVYKNGNSDCTNGGVTANVDKAVLIGDGIPEIFKPCDDAPALYTKIHYMGDVIAVPYDGETDDWYMFGGNFVYSSDSRFRTLVSGQPIRVHDRREPYRV